MELEERRWQKIVKFLKEKSYAFLSKLEDLMIYDYSISKTSSLILRSPLFANNPFYFIAYYTNMKKKMKQFGKMPRSVRIENTNICNSNCIFCPHSQMKRKIGFMNNSLYRKIIDECASIGSKVYIIGYGEPLIDKNLPDKVTYAKQKGIKVVTVKTNGLLLDEKIANSLIESKLDHISISVDAASEEMFRKIRDLHYYTINENIFSFVKLRNKMGLDRPIVELSFLMFTLNEREVKEFISKYQGIVDRISFGYLHNWCGKFTNEDIPHTGKKVPCPILWTQMQICWDGRIALCCLDGECEVELGNANETSIVKVWNDKILGKLREIHSKGKFNEISLCKECSNNSYLRYPWWI